MTTIEAGKETGFRLGIPNEVQLTLVSQRLKEMYGFDFPITREFGGVVPLSTHKIEGKLANFLRMKKYLIGLRSHNRVLLAMPQGPFQREVLWWFKDNNPALTLEAWWRIDPNGVTIILETDPLGGGGNQEEATILARDLKEAGEDLFAFVHTLIARESKIFVPWKDLMSISESA